MKTHAIAIMAAFLSVCLGGCITDSYSNKDGTTFTRTAFLAKSDISGLKMNLEKGSVSIGSVANDQSASAETLIQLLAAIVTRIPLGASTLPMQPTSTTTTTPATIQQTTTVIPVQK
jgi:hypothetical protein